MFIRVDEVNILLSLVASVVLFSAGFLYVMSNNVAGRSFLLKVFSIAFLLRVLMAFALYFSLISMGSDGYIIEDDRVYNFTALAIDKDIDRGRVGYKQYESGFKNIAYFNFGGFMYHHFGFDTLTMRIINAFFGSVVVLLVYYIMLQIFDMRIARISALFMAFLPNLIFWSASHVKDPLVTLVTISLVYIMVCKFRRGLNPFVLVFYIFFMYLLWHLRKDYCFPLIGVAILWGFIRYTALGRFFNNHKRSNYLKMAIMVVFAVPLFYTLLSSQAGTNFIGTVDKFNQMQEHLSSEGAAGFTRYMRISGPGDIYKLPAAMIFTSMAPLPNFGPTTDWRKYGHKVYSFINLSLVLLMPLVFFGFLKFTNVNMKFTDELLVKWLPLFTWASVSIFYMGVLRYKSGLLPYFVMWASVAWAYRHQYSRHILFMYGATMSAVLVIIPVATIFR